MRFHHQLHIVQADAESFYVVNIACRYTEEFLKHLPVIFRADADTIVFNGDIQEVVEIAGCDDNLRSFFTILQSIIEQVKENIGEMQFIGFYRRSGSFEDQFDVAVGDLIDRNILHGLVDDLMNVEDLRFQVYVVFFGRSMDVFISKLRKYLKDDPTVQIVNYHGIGFRLEIK